MREMGIATGLAERGGINEIDVPFDQFGESGFGPGPGVLAKQFIVRLHIRLKHPPLAKIAQRESL